MLRNILIFLGTFVAGAVIALVARAAMFNPHDAHSGPINNRPEHASMVSNPLVPATSAVQASKESSSAVHDHAVPANPAGERKPPATHSEHQTTDESTKAASLRPVNTICAICGMPVDPTLPTLEYQGKRIGFGCKLCPPKFKAEPDRYGPFYLRDERVTK